MLTLVIGSMVLLTIILPFFVSGRSKNDKQDNSYFRGE